MSPDPGHSGEGRAAELFWEYLKAIDAGEEPDVESLLERAGSAREELKRRIATYTSIATLADGDSARSDAVPERIGRYRVDALLGKGGLGTVYLGYDDRLDRPVALKLLDSTAILGAERRMIVVNEARVMAQLSHPNVAGVYEVDTTGDVDFLVMEYVPGPSLHDVIGELLRRERNARTGDVEATAGTDDMLASVAANCESPRGRVDVLAGLADALHYCHEQGVLHRDIKPANVLFDADGQPKLIDFGLAHLARADEADKAGMTSRLVGTAAYVAPEQVEEGRIGTDPRSEVFSFGTLAYEFLTLWNPFERGRRTRTLDAVTEASPRPPRRVAPNLTVEVDAIVMHALQRAPEHRYPTLLAISEDLRAFLDGHPVAAMRGRFGRRALQLARTRARLLSVALLLAIVGVTAFLAGRERDVVRAGDDSAIVEDEARNFLNSTIGALGALYAGRYAGTGAEPPFEPLFRDGERVGTRPTRALIEFAIEEAGIEDPFVGMDSEERGRLLDKLRNGGEFESFLESLIEKNVDPDFLEAWKGT